MLTLLTVNAPPKVTLANPFTPLSDPSNGVVLTSTCIGSYLLRCRDYVFPAFPATDATNLYLLRCRDYVFSAFPATGTTNLYLLRCRDYVFSAFLATGATNLYLLRCRDYVFSAFPATGATNLYLLHCRDYVFSAFPATARSRFLADRLSKSSAGHRRTQTSGAVLHRLLTSFAIYFRTLASQHAAK